jgi:hypothetical protein
MMGQTPDAPNPPGDPVDTKRPRQSGPNGQLDANGDFVPEIMLLAECPHCRYALRGLPIAHYCPECGQPVDRQWKVIGAPQDQPGPAWQRYIIAALKWYLIAHIALTMLSFARQSNLAAFAIFALCAAILWQIWRVSTARGFRRRRSARFAHSSRPIPGAGYSLARTGPSPFRYPQAIGDGGASRGPAALAGEPLLRRQRRTRRLLRAHHQRLSPPRSMMHLPTA